MPIALPENAHYETVSGYINYIFGRIPAVNDKRKKDGYELTILKRTRQSVDTVRLKMFRRARRMSQSLNAKYWDDLYLNNDKPWDMGQVFSTA